MKNLIEKLDNSNHITITVNAKNISLGSCLYSYLLTQHKKVSFVKTEYISQKFSFLPWFDKLRDIVPTSSDFIYEMDVDFISLYGFLKSKNQKINQKMATALYSALLLEYDFFKSKKVDGTTFAYASELVGLKAQHILCVDFLQNLVPLSVFRLKSILYKHMILTENGEKANFYICDDDLKSSGASIEDAQEIIKDALSIAHVKEVALFKIEN